MGFAVDFHRERFFLFNEADFVSFFGAEKRPPICAM